MKLIILLLTFFLITSLSALAIDFQPIPKNQVEYGCGCGYRTKPPTTIQPVFQSELSFEGPRAFVAGKLVSLEPVDVEQLSDKPKVGDVFTQHYRYEDLELFFVNTVTFVCPQGSEGGCEVIRFDSELKITQGNEVQTMSLSGDCGC